MFFATSNLKNDINNTIKDQRILFSATCEKLDILFMQKKAHIERKKFLSVPRTEEELHHLPGLIPQAGLKDFAGDIKNAISTLIDSIVTLKKNPANSAITEPHFNQLHEVVNRAIEYFIIKEPSLLLDKDLILAQKCLSTLAEKLSSDSQNIHIPQKMVR